MYKRQRIDGDGYDVSILDEIVDHKVDASALKQSEGFTYKRNGEKVPKQTTRGWKFLIRLKDQSTEWVKLKDLKESNPVELAEYAKANHLVEEPAFKWWVPFTLGKRNRILKKMKNRYWRTTHKFGIELPKTVKDAKRLDAKNGNTLWMDALKKEMKTVWVAFKILDEDAEEPKAGRNFLKCHIVWDLRPTVTKWRLLMSRRMPVLFLGSL